MKTGVNTVKSEFYFQKFLYPFNRRNKTKLFKIVDNEDTFWVKTLNTDYLHCALYCALSCSGQKWHKKIA